MNESITKTQIKDALDVLSLVPDANWTVTQDVEITPQDPDFEATPGAFIVVPSEHPNLDVSAQTIIQEAAEIFEKIQEALTLPLVEEGSASTLQGAWGVSSGIRTDSVRNSSESDVKLSISEILKFNASCQYYTQYMYFLEPKERPAWDLYLDINQEDGQPVWEIGQSSFEVFDSLSLPEEEHEEVSPQFIRRRLRVSPSGIEAIVEVSFYRREDNSMVEQIIKSQVLFS